jgi:hypothetical protein
VDANAHANASAVKQCVAVSKNVMRLTKRMIYYEIPTKIVLQHMAKIRPMVLEKIQKGITNNGKPVKNPAETSLWQLGQDKKDCKSYSCSIICNNNN